MNKTVFARMPIEDSPWNDGRHDPESVNAYIQYFRGLGKSVADLLSAPDSKTAESFLTQARQGVAQLDITTRAHQKTSQTTFRFGETKDDGPPVTIFIVSDSSRIEALKKPLGLIEWCMLLELKRHPNHKRAVYIELDEASNNFVEGLESLKSWGRASGIKLHIVVQNLPAYEKTYGKSALRALLSESEVKLFLPNQRDAETLNLLSQSYLGQYSYIATGRSGNLGAPDYRLNGFDYREDGKPLMSADEIRRINKGILFIRKCRPVLVDLPPIAAIAPFRDQIAIDPFHGKPFRLPVQLTLNEDGTTKIKRSLWQRIKRRFAGKLTSNPERKLRYLNRSLMAFRLSVWLHFWWVPLFAVFMASPIGPHMLVWYDYSQYSSVGSKSYYNCQYLGSRGVIEPDVSADCPLLVFIDSRDWR